MAIKIIVFGTSVQHFPIDVVAWKHLVPIDVVARLSECPLGGAPVFKKFPKMAEK